MNRTTLDTLARLGQEMAEEGRTVEEQALRDAVAELGRFSGGLLTTGEAADRLHVSIPTVKRWIERGALSGVDTGTRWLVTEESVERVIRVRRNLKEMDEEGNPTDEEILELTKRTRRRPTEKAEHVA
jgi:excisionase family DNA binding protein